MKKFTFYLAAALLSLSAAQAQAWSFDRSNTWEGFFQLHYQFEEKIEAQDDVPDNSYMKIRQDIGWGFGFGYNFNRYLNASFNFNNTRASYDAVLSSSHPEGPAKVRHTSDYYAFQLNGQWSLFDTEFTPIVQAGLGSGNFDTNISNGNYYCSGYYYWWCYSDSYSSSGFTFNVGLGARWDYSRTGFVKMIYVREHLDLGIHDDPEFDTIQLQFGGKF